MHNRLSFEIHSMLEDERVFSSPRQRYWMVSFGIASCGMDGAQNADTVLKKSEVAILRLRGGRR